MASDERRLHFRGAYAAREQVRDALNSLLVLSKFRFLVSNKKVKALKERFDSEMGYQQTDFVSQKMLLDEIMNLVYKVAKKKIAWLLMPKYFYKTKQTHEIKYFVKAFSKEHHRKVLFKALKYSGEN